MWLKLDLSGTTFEFRVLNYNPTHTDNWYDQWCQINLACHRESWLNFSLYDENLLSCEIDEILKSIDDLLNDRLNEPTELTFIEPDFTFIFNPKKDLTKDPRYTFVRPGYEIEDIDTELKISFWNGGLTANYLSLRFYRKDLLDLRNYLLLATRKITETDKSIQEMIKSGKYY